MLDSHHVWALQSTGPLKILCNYMLLQGHTSAIDSYRKTDPYTYY